MGSLDYKRQLRPGLGGGEEQPYNADVNCVPLHKGKFDINVMVLGAHRSARRSRLRLVFIRKNNQSLGIRSVWSLSYSRQGGPRSEEGKISRGIDVGMDVDNDFLPWHSQRESTCRRCAPTFLEDFCRPSPISEMAIKRPGDFQGGAPPEALPNQPWRISAVGSRAQFCACSIRPSIRSTIVP